MGCNFYWRNPDGSPGSHIGKRSAAGWFCWDCNWQIGGGIAPHLVKCPRCGKGHVETVDPLTGRGSPAGIELGMASPRSERPKGVEGTSRFIWAKAPESVRAACEAEMDRVLIVDEYGHEITGRVLLSMLRGQCGIEDTSSIGQEFS